MSAYVPPRSQSASGRAQVPPGDSATGYDQRPQAGYHNTKKYQSFEAHHGGSIGDVSIRNKRTSFRIGKFDLGLGQAAAAAAVLLGGGGAGVAAVATHEEKKPDAVVRQAAGRWTFSGQRALGSATVTGAALAVTPEAIYDVSLTLTHSGSPTTASCTGEVTARGKTLLFTPFDKTGCRTFTATVIGDAMTLGSAGDTIQLQRR